MVIAGIRKLDNNNFMANASLFDFTKIPISDGRISLFAPSLSILYLPSVNKSVTIPLTDKRSDFLLACSETFIGSIGLSLHNNCPLVFGIGEPTLI